MPINVPTNRTPVRLGTIDMRIVSKISPGSADTHNLNDLLTSVSCDVLDENNQLILNLRSSHDLADVLDATNKQKLADVLTFVYNQLKAAYQVAS